MWLWGLALRVAVLGWHDSVTNGDSANDCMESAMREAGLTW